MFSISLHIVSCIDTIQFLMITAKNFQQKKKKHIKENKLYGKHSTWHKINSLRRRLCLALYIILLRKFFILNTENTETE